MEKKLPIIIIGSGLSGYTLAKELRKSGVETPLVIITQHAGRFYSKPQLSTALAKKKDINALTVASAEAMAQELSATVLSFKTVDRIDADEKRIVCDGESMQYDRLVLAQGASPVKLSLLGDAADKVISINDLMAYEQFHAMLPSVKRVIVLGTGLVGCEFANDLIQHGVSVTMISPDQYPLQQLVPADIGVLLQETLAEHGVVWHLKQFAESVSQSAAGLCVETSTGAQHEADCVISAVGLVPNCGLAKSANIQVNRGICVNECLQTSADNIYALGDCAELKGQVRLYVAPLLHCAKALAKTLSGKRTEVNYPLMPVGIKTSLCPVVVLLPEKGVEGEWRVDGDKPNLRALFYDKNASVQGFVLTGSRSRERMALTKEIAAS